MLRRKGEGKRKRTFAGRKAVTKRSKSHVIFGAVLNGSRGAGYSSVTKAACSTDVTVSARVITLTRREGEEGEEGDENEKSRGGHDTKSTAIRMNCGLPAARGT